MIRPKYCPFARAGPLIVIQIVVDLPACTSISRLVLNLPRSGALSETKMLAPVGDWIATRSVLWRVKLALGADC